MRNLRIRRGQTSGNQRGPISISKREDKFQGSEEGKFQGRILQEPQE